MQGANQNTSSTPSWVTSVAVIGIFLMGIYIAFVFLAPKSDHLTSEADGLVSRVEVKKSTSKNRTKYTYLTYVTFTDSDHQTFTARSVVNGSDKRHEEGDYVTVHYDPRDPEAGCLIEGDEDQLFIFNALRYFCGIGGAVALLASVVGFLYFRFLRGTSA